MKIQDIIKVDYPFLLDPTSTPPTDPKDALIRAVRNRIQTTLDAKAREYIYDDINTAVSYAAYDNIFKEEGEAFGKWRSECWEWSFKLLEQLQAEMADGKLDSAPDLDEIFKSMPQFKPPKNVKIKEEILKGNVINPDAIKPTSSEPVGETTLSTESEASEI